MATAGDRAFEEQFDTLANVAYRVAFRILGDREESRDIAQESLARAYARWRRVERYAEPWVARVAGNLALGVARRNGRRPPAPAGPPPVPDATGTVDDRHLLVGTLRQLPAGQRDTLLLRYVADLPEAEVARLLGCSVGTVKSQAHRALRRLRPDLTDALDPSPDEPSSTPLQPLDPRSL